MATDGAGVRPFLAGLVKHAGTIHPGDPLTVESIPAQWAYTVSVPIELGHHQLPVVVSATVSVQEGTLGALVVAQDLTTVLARVPPSVRAGTHSLDVVVETLTPGARFVLRNTTPGNQRCLFTLADITVRAAAPDALSTASLLQTVSEGDPPRLNLSKLRRAVTSPTHSKDWNDDAVFDLLRTKWTTVPAGLDDRRSSTDLLQLSDAELESLWGRVHREATTDQGFPVRGWYQTLYRDVLRGKAVLDVGSGMGIDGVEFARHGARVTFVDIVESNLQVLSRLCRIFGAHDVRFLYLKNLAALEALTTDFDVVWCQGSMINAPFEFSARESAAILKHLKPGGRWIELAYPRERWERDGRPSFSVWGTMTDGEGTPWMEWYDLERLLKRLAPATFAPVLALNFHNDDFNWFDLVRTS
jgi:2-polyprenyl-3-methyl-5-hydroxy-6-metoxy-1,4-benzoquinol methylase